MNPVTPAGGLVGRDSEMALLIGFVREVVRGRGSAALIEGEPGIGKSALVRAATAAASEAGGDVFWGSRRRAEPGAATAAVPRRIAGTRAVGQPAAGHHRPAAARRDHDRPRRRRARGAGRAVARAGRRTMRGAADRPGRRRPAVGRPGQRHAVGAAGEDGAAGAVAAHRDGAPGARTGTTCSRCTAWRTTDARIQLTGLTEPAVADLVARWPAAGRTTACSGWPKERRATRSTSPNSSPR